MEFADLLAISPVDGRYRGQTEPLAAYFSEASLIRYRLKVETAYFTALIKLGLPQLSDFPKDKIVDLLAIPDTGQEGNAKRVKEIEKQTNHDIKAVENFLRERFSAMGLQSFQEFIHFGLTSQDINNTAFPLALKDAFAAVIFPLMQRVLEKLEALAKQWKQVPMLARTHGQPASPTLLGKEIMVFAERLRKQVDQLRDLPFEGKFGGATGNLNAHYAAYPQLDWISFANDFLEQDLGLKRQQTTTQIEHYDNLAAFFDAFSRCNTILIDACRDIWTYISMDYFKQQVVAGEVGSSTMPHKVNPIDFENAEGNLGIANALFHHLSAKLPISRLQRDLTDSTVIRNIGVPLSHSLIAMNSIIKGLDKLRLNETKIQQDLHDNLAVITEAIQTILRRESYPEPYQKLKELSRGQAGLTRESIHRFIDSLAVTPEVKAELKALSPETYTGKISF